MNKTTDNTMKKLSFYIITSVLFNSAIAYSQNDDCINLVVNGGFEEGAITDGVNQYEASSIPGWSLGSIVHKGNKTPKLEIRKNVNRKAAEGVSFLELDTKAKIQDEIFQDVTTKPNTEYELSFEVRARKGTRTFYDNLFHVVWNGRAEKEVGGGIENGKTKWEAVKIRLNSEDKTTSRFAFREVYSGSFGGDTGLAPSIDNVMLCEIGPSTESIGRVSPPADKRQPKKLHETVKSVWFAPKSYKAVTDGYFSEAFFGGGLIIEGDDTLARSKNFLSQHSQEIGLDSITSSLIWKGIETTLTEGRIVAIQKYESYLTGRNIEFSYLPSGKLSSINSGLMPIKEERQIVFPDDMQPLIQSALNFLKANNITGHEVDTDEKWVYIEDGIPRAVVSVEIKHPRIDWSVVVDAMTNEALWATDLRDPGF